MKVVAVTGATGYVGSQIVKDLAPRYRVRAVVRDVTKAAALKSFDHSENIEFVTVPDLVTGDFTEAFRGADFVVHCASPVKWTSADPENEIIKPAVEGTLNVLRAAAKQGVKRVVYTATMASICGTQREKNPNHVWTEADWNDAPGSDYSRSKTMAEKAAWDFVKEHPGVELVTIHPSLVLGPLPTSRADLSSMNYFIDSLKGKYKDGGVPPQMFGVVDNRDVSRAHLLALEKPEAAGQRYIVGSADQWSLFELNVELKKLFPGYPLGAVEQKPQTPKKNGTDNSKVRTHLGLVFTPLAQTFSDMVQSLVTFGFIPKL